MQCHTCPHAAGVAAGKYAGKPFSATPCYRCIRQDPEIRLSHRGRTTVQWTEGVHDMAAKNMETIDEIDFPEALLRVVRALLQMRPKRRNIVMDKIAHPDDTLEDIGGRHGIGKSAVQEHLQNAAREHDFLRRLVVIRKHGDTVVRVALHRIEVAAGGKA